MPQLVCADCSKPRIVGLGPIRCCATCGTGLTYGSADHLCQDCSQRHHRCVQCGKDIPGTSADVLVITGGLFPHKEWNDSMAQPKDQSAPQSGFRDTPPGAWATCVSVTAFIVVSLFYWAFALHHITTVAK